MKGPRKLLLLMWKHYHLRKHRWFLTLIEIFLPIVITYLFCSEGTPYIEQRHTLSNVTMYPVNTIQRYFRSANMLRLIYTPSTPLIDALIQRVKKLISFESVRSVKTEDELVKDILNSSGSTVGVVFLNTEDVLQRPFEFKYKIRDTNNWNTELLFYPIVEPGPQSFEAYESQGFAGLQIALDTAFFQEFQYTYSMKNIQFAAFPYPEYEPIDPFKLVVPQVICYAVIATSLILSIPLISLIIEEKESGVKELMKLVGVEEWLIQFSWFANAIIPSLFSYCIVAYFLQRDFQGPQSALFSNVPVWVIWCCIISFSISNVAFSFTFSAIFHSVPVATSIFTLLFGVLVYAATKVTSLNSVSMIKLACLLPIIAFHQGFQRIQYIENHNIPLTWSTLSVVEDETKGVSLPFVFLILVFDTFLYLLLTYYITCINPGSFGSRRPPLFFLEFLWSTESDVEELVEMEDNEDQKFFESAPSTLQVSIEIRNLHKHFGSFHAVRGLNLKVYRDEITALLGHNGAGKTTTMAMLTGMLKPNAGSIIHNDEINVLENMSEFREKLGMCPQEDRLFPYMTVINHLLFFGMLKGASKSEALAEANGYLQYMEMSDKANVLSTSLSGGMKRKLCLAIALMGDVETLILDEPSSGIDVESRRKIWDLLLDLRGNRTIILSTHHMEEADVLGDRIAIMDRGTVVCHGTSMFLKRVYGTGYQVTFTTKKEKESALTKAIQNIVPRATKESQSNTEIVYNLPLTESATFPKLFASLEGQKSNLGIENIGVACTTMEQVFLKVGGTSVYDVSRKGSKTVTDGNILSELSKSKTAGLWLILQQLLALFEKRYLYTKRNLINFAYRILLPTLLVLLIVYVAETFLGEPKPLPLSVTLYPKMKVMALNTGDTMDIFTHKFTSYVENNGGTVLFVTGENIMDLLLDYGRKHLSSYQTDILLAGSYGGDSQKILLYNPFAFHSLPVLINIISNVEVDLLSHGVGSVEAFNHPIRNVHVDCDKPTTDVVKVIIWFVVLAFYSIDVCYYFSNFLSMERVNGFKHIQLMSNVSPLIYWFSNFIFDVVFVFAIVFLRIFTLKLINDRDGFLQFVHPFGILILLLACSVSGILLFLYVLNFFSNSTQGSYTLLFVLNIFGSLVTIGFYFVEKLLLPMGGIGAVETSISLKLGFYFFKYLIHLVPPLNYSLAFMKFASNWFDNAFALKPGCIGRIPVKDYLEFASPNNINGLLSEVIFMAVDVVLYTVLLFVIEAGYFSWAFNQIIKKFYAESEREQSTEVIDPEVEVERKKVQAYQSQPSKYLIFGKRNSIVEKRMDFDSDVNESIPLNEGNQKIALAAHDLKKVFVSKTLRPFVAVNDVNFAINSGETFGLLGVNGAGKSTTFQMLTGILLPTKGDSIVQSIRLSQNRSKYLSKAGYCAQSNNFIEELTGREMLKLIAGLRGIRPKERRKVVDKWLSILDLESIQNRKCGRYSGGNKRKLCTAMSLIGDPNVVFLDEPTTGVDPVSRRKLYDVMEYSKSLGQTVVLTSHSMEECENLCDRLTIMTKGRMNCIGTAQRLKQQFAQGFSILIKTRNTSEDEDEDELISALKDGINSAFGDEYCILKDEHKGVIYYQITNVNLQWSTLFDKMESLKKKHNVMEDYTVADTTLEEVFISFAQQESEDDESS